MSAKLTKDIDQFTRGYLECACWADAGGISLDDIPEDLLAVSIIECRDFQEANTSLLEQYCEKVSAPTGQEMSYAGHDFYLTRCGHGAGFWDRGLGDLGDRLTKVAKGYSSLNDFAILRDE